MTPESIEAVLADFRTWLEQVAETGTAPAPPAVAETAEPIDLNTLLEQFVALRHEVNLQTRAARVQQEQNAETLRQLSRALDDLEQARAAETGPEAEAERLRPFLKTLVDLADALGLAQGAVERVQRELSAARERDLAPSEPADELPVPPAPRPRRSFWSGWFGRDRGPREEAAPAAVPHARPETEQRIHQLLDSILTGYRMSLQRIERALQQHALEPIPSVGQTFDPERMEAVEVAAESGGAPGEVLAEVRRGYLWRGRVFRYAQVRVARPSRAGERES